MPVEGLPTGGEERALGVEEGPHRRVRPGFPAELLCIEVVESEVESSLVSLLASLPGAVVFPVLHGEAGEDGALREVLALLDVPFVGSIGSL